MEEVLTRLRERLQWLTKQYGPVTEALVVFKSAEVRFKELGDVANLSKHMTLLDKSNLDHLERLIRWPELFLPFFGPNSAGKSSVINAILGIQAMPKGEGAVTGRVCAISYAEEASIELLPLDKFVEHLPGERVALPNH